MAKIGLSDGFSLIPEGTHVFKITGVSYKEAFGKLEVTMQTQSGAKHIERFSLLKADGSTNEGALNAFSYFAKTALQDFELSEIDHEDLVGHFIECDIEHDVQPNKNKPDKTITFARLADKRPSDGWDDQAAPPAPATPKKAAPAASQAAPAAPKSKSDLMALLG